MFNELFNAWKDKLRKAYLERDEKRVRACVNVLRTLMLIRDNSDPWVKKLPLRLAK